MSPRHRGSLVALALLAGLAALPYAAACQGRSELRIRVTESEAGQPLMGALVRIRALDRTALADAGGWARLTGLPAGTHQVEVARLGYRPETRAVTLDADGSVESAVTLEPQPVELEGVVAFQPSRAACVARALSAAAERRANRLTLNQMMSRARSSQAEHHDWVAQQRSRNASQNALAAIAAASRASTPAEAAAARERVIRASYQALMAGRSASDAGVQSAQVQRAAHALTTSAQLARTYAELAQRQARLLADSDDESPEQLAAAAAAVEEIAAQEPVLAALFADEFARTYQAPPPGCRDG